MALSLLEIPTDKDRLLVKTSYAHRFRCEDNNVDFMRMQQHYFRVRQMITVK